MLIFAVVMLVAALVLSLMRERCLKECQLDLAQKTVDVDYLRECGRLARVDREKLRTRVLVLCRDLYEARCETKEAWRLYRAWEERHNRLVQKIRSVGAEG